MRSTIASSTSADAEARLGRDAQHVVGRAAEEVGDLLRPAIGLGRGQVDLVQDGHDLEVVLDREVRVRERLRLEPLRGVDDEQRALAGGERARDLVGEVDVPGRIDQVQRVHVALVLPEHAHGLGLDRDAALALEIHRVEQLRAHLAGRHGVRDLEDAVGERRLAVVDVRDDREVAGEFQAHTSHGRRCGLGATWLWHRDRAAFEARVGLMSWLRASRKVVDHGPVEWDIYVTRVREEPLTGHVPPPPRPLRAHAQDRGDHRLAPPARAACGRSRARRASSCSTRSRAGSPSARSSSRAARATSARSA